MSKKPSIDLLPNDMRNGFTIWLVVGDGHDSKPLRSQAQAEEVLHVLSEHGPKARILRVDVNATHVTEIRAGE